MTHIDFKKYFPHGETNYREIAFIQASLPFLDYQYAIPEEGILSSLKSLRWGLTPPTILTESWESNKDWIFEQKQSPRYFDFPDELFCSCLGTSDESIESRKKDYYEGFSDWVKTLEDWQGKLVKLREPLWNAGKIEVAVYGMDSDGYGWPDFTNSGDPIRIYADRAYEVTEKTWQKIEARHRSFLDSCKLVAEYEWFDEPTKITSLGGCFFHVVNDDGIIRVIEPEEDLVNVFCNEETDCIVYPGQDSCSVEHDCYDDELDDARVTLRLFK
jgi:hypothetical protein